MTWDDVLQWIKDNKDALGWLFGTGVIGAVAAGVYKVVAWLLRTRRERQLRSSDNSFWVLPPASDVLAAVFPSANDSPLDDRRIPYRERIPGRSVRREMEDLLRKQRALLVRGRSGLGKTREAAHLAQTLNNEGWTVLYLPPDAWLEPPAHLPKGMHNRKILLFLDDLSRKCYSARQEINPRAESLTQPLTQPFQERLHKTLEAYETFCGKGEILILATTRDERTPQYEGEPAEWDKLEWKRYPELWERFALYELPEPDPDVAADLLSESGQAAGVRVEDAEALARRNDGTLRNLVENLRRAANPERGLPALTPENFVDTLRGTWEARYHRAIEHHPEAKFIYQSAALLRRYDFPLSKYTILPVARALMGDRHWWRKGLPLWRAWHYLERHENITTPRDGQLEIAKEPLDINDKTICSLWKIAPLNFWRQENLVIPLIAVSTKGFVLQHKFLVTTTLILCYPHEALAISLYTVGQREKAKRVLEQQIQRQNINAFTIGVIGFFTPDLLDQLGQLETVDFTALEWNELANAYKQQGRYGDAIAAYKKAIEHYHKAVKIDPEYKWAYNNMGDVYRKQERYKDAIAAYQKAIALDEKDATPWVGLGNVYYQQERYDDAIAAYQKAIELDEKEAGSWVGLGNIYHQQERYDDAIASYKKAIELDEKYAASWNNLGNVYYDLDRYDDAIAAYGNALKWCQSPDICQTAQDNLELAKQAAAGE